MQHKGSRRQEAYLKGLKQHFKDFDEAYRDNFYEFTCEELKKESRNKYQPNNCIKLSYLVLSKKSRKRIASSYFME